MYLRAGRPTSQNPDQVQQLVVLIRKKRILTARLLLYVGVTYYVNQFTNESVWELPTTEAVKPAATEVA